MCQVIDTDQDVRISEMGQVQIFDDLDLGSFQIFGLVGQGLAVEVLGHGRCDPDSGRVLYPYSGTLKSNKKAALFSLCNIGFKNCSNTICRKGPFLENIVFSTL